MKVELSEADWQQVVSQSKGYSGSDIRHVVEQACSTITMETILRAKASGQKTQVQRSQCRAVVLTDLQVSRSQHGAVLLLCYCQM